MSIARTTPAAPPHLETDSPAGDWLHAVKATARGLHYGVIQIVFHDSRVVQIERTERIRLERPNGRGGDADI